MKFLAAVLAVVALVAGCGSSKAPVSVTSHAGKVHLVGTLNPAVTQSTIGKTVCRSGWTATVRPPAAWTNALKRGQLPKGARLSAYEEDHQMPIELGGAPKDPANLWPVPVARAKSDDKVENRLHRELCAGSISLAQAQQEMSRTKADEGSGR